jgi:hypothetical protein
MCLVSDSNCPSSRSNAKGQPAAGQLPIAEPTALVARDGGHARLRGDGEPRFTRQADMTITAVRWGATRATTFLTAPQRLHDLDLRVGGVVVVGAGPKKGRAIRVCRQGSPSSLELP